MKLLRSVVACAVISVGVLVNASPLPIDDLPLPTDGSATQPAHVFGRSVCKPLSKPKGRLFNIGGTTQYFAGTNAWWLGHLWQNSDVDLALSQIAATGYKVVRTWGFGTTNNAIATTDVYYQVLNSSGQYFNYNPSNGIPRLDYAIATAETYGLQLVLPLLNNYDDLGGINTYTNAFGGSHNDFYTNPAAQKAYKKYIKLIVNRYKSSCAIFAWQLANEPRCSTFNSSVIYNWASDISKYIKSLDSRHMVSLGDEGWLTPPQGDGSYAYSGYEGVDFVKNLGIPTLDYGTFHLYPSQWGYNYTWGNTWIEQHNAIGQAAGKPVVLEEYGFPDQSIRKDVESEWQTTVLNKTSVAYDSVWQFGTRFPSGVNPFDEYAVYYDKDEYDTLGNNTDEYDTLGNKHAKDMSAKKAKAIL